LRPSIVLRRRPKITGIQTAEKVIAMQSAPVPRVPDHATLPRLPNDDSYDVAARRLRRWRLLHAQDGARIRAA
jgi:hypothetical protein